MSTNTRQLIRLALLLGLALPVGPAWTDTTAHQFEQPVNTSRDANMNRQAVIGAGASAGGGVAMANSVMVSQQGRGNTLVLNVNQQNSGDISAGTTLNGSISLD